MLNGSNVVLIIFSIQFESIIMNLPEYKHTLLTFCIKNNILRFGNFTLKSGRQSPYFFNSGLFNTGEALNILANAYRCVLMESGISFDVLMGAAYKGIPLVCATAMAFSNHDQQVMPFCFNRKEVKKHGEGGQLVGSPLENNQVMLIDDVMTSGKAIEEVAPLIQSSGGKLAGICIALDRQEKGKDTDKKAVEVVSQHWGVPILSILTLENILLYLETDNQMDYVNQIKQYQNSQ